MNFRSRTAEVSTTGIDLQERKGAGRSEAEHFLYSDVSDEMIETPNPAEPPYVAKARFEILTQLRETRQMDNTECRILITRFNTPLKHIDQMFVSGLVQSEERACRDRGIRVSFSDKLTIELKALCKFFISRSEQNPADSINKYPFADQMKYKTGRYTLTMKVRISSKGPKASGKPDTERTRDEENLGLTQEEIENPVDDEPLYKALRRRTILEQKRRDNRLSDGKMRELILKLKTKGSEGNYRSFADRRLSKMNIPVYGRPTESQKLEAELFGLCDMLIDRHEKGNEEENKAIVLSDIENPKPDESASEAIDRRDKLMAARKAGELHNKQVKDYIRDFMVQMTNSEKQLVLEKMIQFKKNSSLIPTPTAELTEKLKIVCDHFVNAAEERDRLATGGYSVPYSDIEEQEERLVPGSGREPTSDIPPLLGSGSLPSSLPPWLAKSGTSGTLSSANIPSNGTTQPFPSRGNLKLDLDGTTEYIVMNPHVAEPKYVSIGRAKVLKEFQRNAAKKFDVNGVGDILSELKNMMPQADMNGSLVIVNEILRSKNVPSLEFMTKMQQLCTRLEAVCEYYMRKSRQQREIAGPYPFSRLLSKLNHPDFVESDIVDSKESMIDTTHRIVMKPHPAEPEYVSQGRFKKMMADRRNGNLDDKKLESVLKEMRNCIPQQDKDIIARVLNDEMRNVGMSFLSLNKAGQLDALLKNTCLYFARKSEQERQAAGPYPYSHLLHQIDHPDFLSPSAKAQPVEKTDEFAYSDLSEFFVMNPSSSEPEIVSKGRFKKLEAQFMSKSPDVIDPEEAAKVARDIKSVLSQREKDAISQAFALLLTSSRRAAVSSESLQLKAICEYFLKLSEEERAKNGPYPHLHLLNKYIRNRQDGQLRGTSRNGQYSARYADFFKKMDIVKRLVGNLAEQNRVNYEFNVTTTSKSQYQASVTIGNAEFKETSTISAFQATSMAIYQTLMKTEYAFHRIPDALKNHRPENAANKVVVRSTDPLRTARLLFKVLQQQKNINVTYTSKPAVFCHIITVQFGREAYTGVGLTDEAARGMADFYAIQQTSYNFDEVPPGVAVGYQGEQYRVVDAEYDTIMQKRREFQNGIDMMMTNEFTSLLIGELEQKAKLGPQDTALVNRKINVLSQKVPKTPEWEKYWKVLVVTKKLEYTCDLIRKRESNVNFIVGNWLDEAKSDVDLRRGPQPTVNMRLPWIPELEPINMSQGPVKYRYEAMKNKIGLLVMKRQNNILDDQQTVGLLQNIRKCLPAEMLVQINERYEKANIAARGNTMGMTMKLTILTHFLLERLEKQMNAANQTSSNFAANTDGTLYNRMMRNY